MTEDADSAEAYDRDRSRGILTDRDWDLLTGSSDQKHDRQYRRRLRQRVRNALLDFRVLFDNWSPSERDQTFVKETEEDRRYNRREKAAGTLHADPEIHDACVALIGLLYQQYRWPNPDFSSEGFRGLLMEGIERGLDRMDGDTELNEIVLEIDTEGRLVTNAIGKYERGESLEFDELRRLIENGVIDPNEIPLQPPDKQEIPESDSE
ncbi:hypothetical protein [Halococcus saccharolyticus]|nr:hypothetical protein [Halococcus saccharolyticus]